MFCHKYLPRTGLALVCLLAATAACGDTNLLPPANIEVAEDSVTLWAATGTAIALPSAYDILLATPARTDRTSAFDFVFDFVRDTLTGDTVPALLPRGAMGLSADGGLLQVATKFDSLTIAPGSGYNSYAPVYLDTATVVVVRSRTETCNFGITSGLYAKVKPVSISLPLRKIVMRSVVDPNCGYRGLQPGLPGS
jgi:hypothetical protein